MRNPGEYYGDYYRYDHLAAIIITSMVNHHGHDRHRYDHHQYNPYNYGHHQGYPMRYYPTGHYGGHHGHMGNYYGGYNR